MGQRARTLAAPAIKIGHCTYSSQGAVAGFFGPALMARRYNPGLLGATFENRFAKRSTRTPGNSRWSISGVHHCRNELSATCGAYSDFKHRRSIFPAVRLGYQALDERLAATEFAAEVVDLNTFVRPSGVAARTRLCGRDSILDALRPGQPHPQRPFFLSPWVD